jgi:hypothetical protein
VVVNFTDEQMVGLQAGCDQYNLDFNTKLTVEDYTQMLCQERAQSCINQYITAFTKEQTVTALAQMAAAGIPAPTIDATPKPVVPGIPTP